MIYLKDGNIPLNLAYDDDIVQEANSTYQLSFKFPLTDGKWNLLKREVFLLADDLHGEQEFFIFEVKKVNSHVQVYAKQVATLLNYYSINSISVDRVPGQTVMTALAGSVKRPCPFTFFSDILDRHTFNESNVSVMDALAKDKHSVIGQWGGDLVRDKYQVKLLKNGGTENESLFMYKKNLSSYEESENINNLKTRLHLKKIIQGQSEGEEDRVIVVTVDSPLISQYSQIYEADIEVNDQDVTDEASLLAYGQRYFGSTLCDLVENSINLDVKGKSDVSVKMFDTVSVFHERFDVDLRLKITSYHFGPMSKRLKSIGFGKVSQSVKSTVASMVVGSVDKATERLSASFEQKLQKEIDNANRHFDAEFEKRVEEINDGIEQSKAEAERYADAIKQEIATEINDLDTAMQSQAQEHDRQVADILSKTQSVESLANQAKTDAASALARANQVKAEAIADARAQVATVNQALNTAKTELQSAIASADQKARDSQASATALRNDLNLQASKILAQAQAQTALTNRVTTVETLADGTRSTVTELSKTVSKATGDIASVTSRTKTVEDTLSQTRTQYEALSQTVNAQTGQIDSINRKTADLQSGIDGVRERFENLRVGGENLLLNAGFENAVDRAETFTVAGVTYTNKSLPHWGNLYNGGIQNPTTSFHAIFRENFEGIGPVIEFNESDGSRNWKAIDARLRPSDIKEGNYTFSTDVYATGTGTKIWFGFYYYNKSGVRNFHSGLTTVKVATVNIWHRISGAIRLKNDIDLTKDIRFYIYAYNFESNSILYLTKPKLENGTVATAFSLAQETIRSEIAEYKRTAEESSTELSRQIQLADGKAVEAKTYAQQTADVIKTRLESLETYKNEEGTRANQYLTASRTETAKQLSAERAAIATNYVAKSIYDENVRGTTLKLNEIKTTADTAKQNLATYQNTVDRKLTELISTTQTLDGKINTASAKITQNANEISKRLTSTQVDKAITDKGYQTKAQVDNNITGRGYITNSALQPYALSTTVQNLVQETADSFSRTISETKALIPTSVGGRNLAQRTSSDWSTPYTSFSGSANTCPQLYNVLVDDLAVGDTLKSRIVLKYTNIIPASGRTATIRLQGNGNITSWNAGAYNGSPAKPISGSGEMVFEHEFKITAEHLKNQFWNWQFRTDYIASGSLQWKLAKVEKGNVFTGWSPAPEDLATVTALHNVTDTVDSHTRTIGAVGETGSILDNVSKVTQTANGLVQEVTGEGGLKTQVSTLAGSYAIKNLTKAGDVLGQINLNKDGSIKLDGSLVQITGKTYIQDGVISSAKIANLDAGKITTGTLDAARIAVNSIDGSKLVFDQAFVNKMTANKALFKQLFAQNAFITSVQAVTLSAKQIAGGIAKALNGGMDVNFDESKINFYTNVAAIRRIYTGHPTQFIKFETEGNYSRTIIGSNRNGGEAFNSATFAGVVVENTNNINTEDNVRIYGDNTLLRHAQGDVGWNINSVTQRIVPANMNAESEIWSKHFVAPDKNSKPVRLDTAVAALWDIWNHIIYNNFEFNAALRTHIKARRDNWKFELNL
ncbi:TPA: phage tail spike protein [Streptococcus suis]